MILKWSNWRCGAVVTNIVGVFVALVLWGSHVQGRRTERAVIPRHTPYFSSKTHIFGVGTNPATHWVNFINPAADNKRQKPPTSVTAEPEDVARRDARSVETGVTLDRTEPSTWPSDNSSTDSGIATSDDAASSSSSDAGVEPTVTASVYRTETIVTDAHRPAAGLALPEVTFLKPEIKFVVPAAEVRALRPEVVVLIPEVAELVAEAAAAGGDPSSALLDGEGAVMRNGGRRSERQATAQEIGAEMIPACRQFVEGNPDKGEFYSPRFPIEYPNNTDCIKVLAANPGHLLRLDFRNEFHIEPSDECRFDFLEVRDGAHGYGDLIGRFCGKEFPPMMTSSGRFLWLRFHSDENIEYKGFSAVYESIPRPPADPDHPDELPECVIEVGGSEGFISSSDIGEERKATATRFSLPLECMWIIRVTPGWRIQMSFMKFELAKPNDCISNFVDVFSDRTDIPSRLKSFCGSIADTVSSKSHVLHVRFMAESKAINSNFEALYTAFRESKSTQPHLACTKDEFDCQDETCISGELRCNNRINCRFRWDEDDCKAKTSKMEEILSSDHIIAILVVFSLIMFGMCFAFVFNCVRKLMHDHKIIKENFRQSRENRLDEIGVIKVPSPHDTGATPGGGVDRRSPSVTSSADATPRHHASRGNGHVDLDDRSHHHHHLHHQRHVSSTEPPPTLAGHQECYVPGAGDLMPILIGATRTNVVNGDAVFLRDASNSVNSDEADDLEMAGYPLPEMRDSECQTRESLFMNTNSDRSVTPPPPPPPPAVRQPNNVRQIGHFSTFGYNRDNRREADVKYEPTLPPPKEYTTMPRHPPPPGFAVGTIRNHPERFRAEAVIEMATGERGGGSGGEERPFSVDSTKSAPDVIVTH